MIDSPPVCQPPKAINMLFEARLPFEAGALMLSAPFLWSLPKGDGRAVMLLPGYMASPDSMWPLKRFLKFLGYRPLDWELGTNTGQVDSFVQRLANRVPTLAAKHGPITVLGWSLGGVIAREVARVQPDSVREIITMGTPIAGGPKYTTVGKVFAEREGLDLDAFEWEVHRRNSIGLTQPITAMYSKTDGIVSWEAAIDRYNSQTRNIEVTSTHVGFGVNPTVWRIIGQTLAASAERKAS